MGLSPTERRSVELIADTFEEAAGIPHPATDNETDHFGRIAIAVQKLFPAAAPAELEAEAGAAPEEPPA